jgi:hypothetical protein
MYTSASLEGISVEADPRDNNCQIFLLKLEKIDELVNIKNPKLIIYNAVIKLI